MIRSFAWLSLLLGILGLLLFWLTLQAAQTEWSYGLGSLVLLLLSAWLFNRSSPSHTNERFRILRALLKRKNKGER